MNLIIPMAGRGSRLRPHTLTVPKPLIPIAGKPMVQRLVEMIVEQIDEQIDLISFVIGDFDQVAIDKLKSISKKVGIKCSIIRQEEPLGTAHAILCAKQALKGSCLIAFADTLFHANFKIKKSDEAVIWVKEVENPEAFGVVKLDKEGYITELVEKPKSLVSKLAIIGIYYFRDAQKLKTELQYLIDNNIKIKGEFQLTDGLESLKEKGVKIKVGEVNQWLDCGNKNATVETNQAILKLIHSENKKLISDKAEIIDSEIIEPCFIDQDVRIVNSKIGPYVSIGKGTVIEDSNIQNSLIQKSATITKANLENSMIGNFSVYKGRSMSISLGDYSVLE